MVYVFIRPIIDKTTKSLSIKI